VKLRATRRCGSVVDVIGLLFRPKACYSPPRRVTASPLRQVTGSQIILKTISQASVFDGAPWFSLASASDLGGPWGAILEWS
jgi:hypothetical protein